MMKLVSLFYICLISPRTAVREVIQEFGSHYVFLGFLIFLFAQASSSISFHMMDSAGVNFFGLILQVLGAVSIGLIHMTFYCFVVHAMVTTMGYQGSFLKLLTWDLFSQAPMVMLCSFWIFGKAFDVFFDNPVLAGLIYFLTLFVLFIQCFYLLGLGIQNNYGIKGWGKVFLVMASSVFICVGIYILLFTGLLISTLGAFVNATG
ncbi:MAG: hypothetical protein VX619_00550 [bacterium]|nr:hypothetical protein [bacterium]